MYEQAEKPKKNKSRVNYTLDTKKIPMLNIFQLMKLHPQKLNVAGEYHDESDKRRDREKLMVADQLGVSSQYWNENEMKKKADSEEKADPLWANALQIPALLLDPEIMKSESTKNEEFKEMQETTALLASAANPAIDRNGLSDNDKLLYDALFNEGKGLMQQIADSISNELIPNYLMKGSKVDPVTKEYENTKYKLLVLPVKGLAERNIYNLNMLNATSISMTRSIAMHKSALVQSKTIGVWKVGDNHVKDILKARGRPSEYQLIHKSDFDRIYGEWEESNKSKELQGNQTPGIKRVNVLDWFHGPPGDKRKQNV